MSEAAAKAGTAKTLDALSDAVESGAGLPAVTRAAARVMGASMVLLDRAEAVLAVANASESQERAMLARGRGVDAIELRVAEEVVGEVRFLVGDRDPPDLAVRRVVATLLALEVERARAPEWASEQAARDFVRAILSRDVTDRRDIVARAAELGIGVEEGAGILVVRAAPRAAQTIDWRARLLALSLRSLRTIGRGAIAALFEDERTARAEGDMAELAAIVPAGEIEVLTRAATTLEAETAESMPGFAITIGYSRVAPDPADLYRAGREAVLAANVAEAEDRPVLAFEDSGSYRLLLSAVSDDRSELETFYTETVHPLVVYDDQYETDLLLTVETYLDCDGNVTPTAEVLFTHRHTVRYRLERIKELTGHDMTSTVGREKVGLGLKAMRVLGIAPPKSPAREPGSSGGRVGRKPKSD